uniref:Replication factor C subunit 2 n=1 Tax=Arundo donax TaxID=35708 RepID=A0A0A9EDY1_ARUDO
MSKRQGYVKSLGKLISAWWMGQMSIFSFWMSPARQYVLFSTYHKGWSSERSPVVITIICKLWQEYCSLMMLQYCFSSFVMGLNAIN